MNFHTTNSTMMKIILISLFLLNSPLIINAQNCQTMTKGQAVADMDYFLKIAEETHMNLYAKLSKASAMAIRDSLIGQMPESLSIDNFAALAVPFSNRFGDGHTVINMPISMYADSIKVMPFTVKIIDGRIFIDEIVNGSWTEYLQPGDGILAINAVKAADIIEKILPYMGGELMPGKMYRMQRGFVAWVRYFFGENIDLNLERNSSVFTIKAPTITRSERGKNLSVLENYSFRFLENNVAYLELNSQQGYSKGQFQTFLEEVFAKISASDCKNFIIDIRKDGGGNSMFGNMLLSYIAPKPYKLWQRYEMKTSSLEKRAFRQYILKWYMYPLYPLLAIPKETRAIFFKKNGSITSCYIEESTPKKVNNKFTGKTYVLTGAGTYSAGADFLVPIKHYNMATVIGEPVSQPYSGYIDFLEFQLPNSRLRAGTSFKYYEYVGMTESNKYQGIEPDSIVERTIGPKDNVLVYTLQLIKNN